MRTLPYIDCDYVFERTASLAPPSRHCESSVATMRSAGFRSCRDDFDITFADALNAVRRKRSVR